MTASIEAEIPRLENAISQPFEKRAALEAMMQEMERVRFLLNNRDTATPAALKPIIESVENYPGLGLAPEMTALMSSPSAGRNGRRAIQTADGRTLEGPGMVMMSSPTGIRAHHGTAHKVDRFRTEKIGTGEGAQAYGWGLYFAQEIKVAKQYQRELAQRAGAFDEWFLKPRDEAASKKYFQAVNFADAAPMYLSSMIKGMKDQSPAGIAKAIRKDVKSNKPNPRYEEAYLALADMIESGELLVEIPNGNLYTVNLKVKDDQLLDYDKPLREQPKNVRAALIPLIAQIREEFPTAIPEDFDINRLAGTGFLSLFSRTNEDRLTDHQLVSQRLLAAGIRGIRYLDGASRNRPLRDIKRDFLNALPENAEFEDVQAAMEDGTFNPNQVTFLKALEADDWFGFDYPAQAISAALSDQISNWEPSDALLASIEPLRRDASYNYVIFDESDIEILEENGKPVSPSALLSSRTPKASDYARMMKINGTPAEVIETTSQALAEESARAREEYDLLGYPIAPSSRVPGKQASIGQQTTNASKNAFEQWKAREKSKVDDEIMRGLMGDLDALARVIDRDKRASLILHEHVTRDIPFWNITGTKIETPSDLLAVMQPIRSPYFESLKVIVVDGNSNVVEAKIVSIGSVAETFAHPADILGILARLRETTDKKHNQIILSHNHPSGETKPSNADLNLTRRLAAVANMAGWSVVDHVITNGSNYFSFRESGMLDDTKTNEKTPKPRKDTGKFPQKEYSKIAPWERFEQARSMRTDSPEAVIEVATRLSSNNKGCAHLLFMNAKLKLLSVQRLDAAEVNVIEIARQVLKARGLDGAYAFALAAPESMGERDAKNLINRVREFSDATQVRFVDGVYNGESTGIRGYISATMSGFMEDVTNYTASVSEDRSSPTSSQVDFAAMQADAPQKLGDVRVGKMHALRAYRTLTAKKAKLGTLTAREEQQLLDAEKALGQKMAFDMDALRRKPELSGVFATQIGRATPSQAQQMEMSRYGETDRAGQMALLSSPTHLGVSPTPPATRINELMSKTPPIYRAVYADLQAGMSPSEVVMKNGISQTAVGNIMRRLESYLGSVTLAAADKLEPAMRDGLIDGGRPDLALSGNLTVAAVDQLREAAGVPEVRSQDSVNKAAAAMLARDYQGTYDMLLTRTRDGAQMTDLEVAATKLIIAQETMGGRIESMEDRMKLAMLIHGYREIGTETARALAMRRDPHLSPAERHAQYIAEALFTPDQETRRRMRKNPWSAESILQNWIFRVDAINQSLLSQGIDIKATLAAFQQEKIDQQEAEAINQQSAEIISQEVKKLNRVERAVIEAMRSGALVTKIEIMTGVKRDRIAEIITNFHKSIRAAMTTAAKNYLESALRSSPSRDVIDDILADMGIYRFDEIDDTRPDFVDRRNEKKKERRKRKSPRRMTPAPTTPPAATPPASVTGATTQPATTPPSPAEPATPNVKQPILETTGTFDLNDPVSVKEVMDAFAQARGSKMDAIMEFWRMSILTGPQTHVVNVGSNLLNAAYNLLPRRGAEAAVNNLLGVAGLGSRDKAMIGEFVPMARNLKKGVALAARNALRSWKLESKVTEAYATAQHIQLDFTGVGSEYIPPALGGKFGKVMRSLSFRAMTAADEFMKSLYAQMEAAAHAHRIAKAENLTGDAYAHRIDQLMVPGSEAWVRAMSEAKRITFQEDMNGDDPRLIHRIDQLAELAKKARAMPYLGKPLTFFLPFIDTPTNIFKQAVLMSPLGTFISIVDGARALRRRVFAGNISKDEAKARATELYDRARLVEDVTNQTIGWMIFFAIESLVAGEDDDELPYITGTVPYKTTARGERDNAYAVMPPQSIRIGDAQFSYSRIEPFATVLASMVDFSSSIKRNGFGSVATSEWLSRFKDAAKDKTFLQGISNLFNAIEDPDRFAERLTANIVTGFVPNIIRQPVREIDRSIRDTNPMADAGFFESVAARIGYGIMPQAAPAKMDVWGKEVPANRGQIIGIDGVDMALRIFDPLNVQVSPPADDIDKWIFQWNRQTADSKDRIAIQPIADSIQGTVPGEKKPRKFALTPEERAEANRSAGRMARAALGDGWDKMPMTQEVAERIKDVVQQAQRFERERLRQEKMLKAPPIQDRK